MNENACSQPDTARNADPPEDFLPNPPILDMLRGRRVGRHMCLSEAQKRTHSEDLTLFTTKVLRGFVRHMPTRTSIAEATELAQTQCVFAPHTVSRGFLSHKPTRTSIAEATELA